jgi:glyoxylase-like metal-dependent hydrolase (beta-lactamase superfamily II)
MKQQKAIFLQLALVLLVPLSAFFSSETLAGDKENNLINRSIKAYGGDKLVQLKSLKLTDNLNHYSKGRSGHAAQGQWVTYLNQNQIELSIDLLNKRKLFKQAIKMLVGSHASNVPSVSHRVFVDGKGYAIDHALQQYQASDRINYDNADFGNSQLLDSLIIRQLNQDRDSSQWTDIVYIQGEPHDVLTVTPDSNKAYTVYLNQKNGYLTRMLTKQGSQLYSYDFLEHKKNQGIIWATQLLISTDKQPVYHSSSRKVSFNSVKNNQFDLPSGYQQRPKTEWLDVSQLSLRKLAEGVYFVGQEWGYTLFIDVGEYYISAGSWQMDLKSHAWKKGLDMLRQQTGNNKPIKQHVVTHHHDDHMMGLDDIVKQGTDLIIHPADIALVQNHLSKPLADDRFVPITKQSKLADGKVILIDIPNSHANHNLVIYLPEHKILFTEDMFGSSFKKAFHSPANWPNGDTYFRLNLLTNKLKQLGLEVDQYLSSHHARVLNQAEIDRAMKVSVPSKETLLNRLFAQ